MIDPDVDRKEKQRALKSEERFGSAAFCDYNLTTARRAMMILLHMRLGVGPMIGVYE